MKECKQLLLLDSNYEVVFLQPISFSMFFSSLPSSSSFVIMVIGVASFAYVVRVVHLYI